MYMLFATVMNSVVAVLVLVRFDKSVTAMSCAWLSESFPDTTMRLVIILNSSRTSAAVFLS